MEQEDLDIVSLADLPLGRLAQVLLPTCDPDRGRLDQLCFDGADAILNGVTKAAYCTPKPNDL